MTRTFGNENHYSKKRLHKTNNCDCFIHCVKIDSVVVFLTNRNNRSLTQQQTYYNMN